MGIVSLPNLGPDPITVNAAVLNGKVDPLATEFNGGIDNDNIASGAGIVYSKLTLTGGILNADINASAGIVDTKLATISTAGKVSATAISVSGLTAVTGVSSDYVVISDVSDSGNPKKALVSDIVSLSTFTPSTSNALAGSVIQVVNTQTGAVASGATAIPDDDTIPQSGEGVEFMTLAITPTNASNKLRIDIVAQLENSAVAYVTGALFQDATAGALAAGTAYCGAGNRGTFTLTHYMAAGTTSATTFKLRAGAASGTTTLNGTGGSRKYGGVMASSITITEIKV